MSIIDGIRERFRKRQEESALTPSDMNRKGRRALGFRGRVSPFQSELDNFVPRFIRRHYDAAHFGPQERTRRERKVGHKIVRLVQKYRLA